MTPDIVLQKAHVFPLGKGGRFVKGFPWREKSARGVAFFPEHHGLWGVDCEKSNLFVLDVDMKNGKNGMESLKSLPTLPPTYTVRTKSGGLHYYFRGQGPTSANKLAPGLDTRGRGGMVRFYDEVVDDSKIAAIPEWLQEWALTRSKVDKQEVASAVEPDQPSNIAEATLWLTTDAPPAVEGDAGDYTTYMVSARMKDLGISEGTAFELMLDHWNDRCEPPWDIEELERKIHNAYRYGKNDLGSGTKEAREAKWEARYEELFGDVPPVEEAEEEPVQEENRPVRLSSLAPGTAPKQKWLLKDWIPLNCVASIYGPPGIGKSLVTIDMAMSLASGADWLGVTVDHPAPVLMVSCEDNMDELHWRADAIRRKAEHVGSAGQESEVYFWDRVGRDSLLATMTQVGPKRNKFLDLLERELAAIAPEGERRVLILDTLIDVGALNENDRSHVNYFIKFILGGFATRHNANVIFLAHPSKSSDVSGSTAFLGSVRAQLFIDWVEEHTDMRRITRGKTNRSAVDSKGGGLLVKWEEGAFHLQDEEAFEEDLYAQQKRSVYNAIKLAEQKGNCLRMAGNSANPIKSHQILDENMCEIPFDRVKLMVNALIDEGSVESAQGKGLKVSTELY